MRFAYFRENSWQNTIFFKFLQTVARIHARSQKFLPTNKNKNLFSLIT